MTISYVEPVKTYVSSGNGAYPFTFKVLAESDIEVWYTSASTGARVQLVRGSDFSVTVSDPGGTVTILGNAPAGGQILIQRRVPIDQPTNWVNNGPFDMDLLEADLDRIIMIAQQLHWDVSAGQAAINYRGPWVTPVEYAERDIVRTVNGNYYFCVVRHTSGTFATDLAAGDWVLLIDFAAIETHATNAAASAADALASRNTAIARSAAAELSEIAAAASAAAASADADEIRDWPVSTGLATDVAEHLAFSRKNLLINGGFDVWQDGPGPFTAGGYAADCWFLVASMVSSVTLERKEFSIAEFEQYSGKRYYTRVSYTLGSSAEDVSYSVRIEDGVRRTAGKTVTLSFLCREAVGKSVYIQYHQYLGGTDYAGEIGTVQFSSSLTRQSVTFEMPSVVGKTFGAGDDSFLEINFIFTERFNTYVPRQSGTFDIGEVQLEFGDTATDFEYRHPAEELALCQRYYEKGTLRGPFVRYNVDYAVGPYCQFLVEKRTAPEVTLGALAPIGHDGTPGALANTNAFTRGFNPVYNWTGGTVGRSFFGQVTWTADARL